MKCVLSDIDVPGAVVPETGKDDRIIPLAVGTGVGVLLALVLGSLVVVAIARRKQKAKPGAVRGMCVLSVYMNTSFCGGVNIIESVGSLCRDCYDTLI